MQEPTTKEALKERLMQYLPIKRRVENQLERLARLKNEQYIPAMREGDGSKHSPGASDRMGNAVIRRLQYEDENMAVINDGLAEMEALRAAINSLPDPMEREVLTLRYIDGDETGSKPMRWLDVAVKLYHRDTEAAEKMAKRLGNKALDNLVEAITDEENNLRL